MYRYCKRVYKKNQIIVDLKYIAYLLHQAVLFITSDLKKHEDKMRAQKSILRSQTKTIKVEQRGLLGGVSKNGFK